MANKKVNATIAIREGTVLPKGENHVLLYSGKGDYYYAVSLDDLFAQSREEAKKALSDFEKAKKEAVAEYEASANENARRVEAAISRLMETESSIIAKMNKITSSYKALSEKLIGLVESDLEVKQWED